MLMPTSCREGEAIPLTAGDVQQVTVHRRHPQVGGAGVKDHGELLRRSPDANLTIILGLQKEKGACEQRCPLITGHTLQSCSELGR